MSAKILAEINSPSLGVEIDNVKACEMYAKRAEAAANRAESGGGSGAGVTDEHINALIDDKTSGKQDKMFDFCEVTIEELDDGYAWTGEIDIHTTNVIVNYLGFHIAGYIIDPDPDQSIIMCPTWNGEALFLLFPDGSAFVQEINFVDRSEHFELKTEVDNKQNKLTPGTGISIDDAGTISVNIPRAEKSGF